MHSITLHRRRHPRIIFCGEEKRKKQFMFRAIRRIMDEHEDVKAIYPIHMNPIVRQIADEELGGCDRIRMIEAGLNR